MSTKYEYANLGIPAAEPRSANSRFWSVLARRGDSPRSPRLYKLFLIGCNWDEVRELKFILDTYCRSVRVLQTACFVVVRQLFSRNLQNTGDAHENYLTRVLFSRVLTG